MSITLQLEKMSVEEKIQAMESIWHDLCEHADSLVSPPWHERLLTEREAALGRGDDKFVDWNIAKRNIKKEL
jgi:hypothetical protein